MHSGRRPFKACSTGASAALPQRAYCPRVAAACGELHREATAQQSVVQFRPH